ncbi:hypothetical protein DV738_g929, partial [Chaetothyriales sp. CBS 135597]
MTTVAAAAAPATAPTAPPTSPPVSALSLERLPNNLPRFHGCSRITDYVYICKLGEGTFGEVSKARCKKTGQIVALKKILMHNEKDGFPITALREIKLLKQLDHVNILKLTEMAVERPKNASKKTSMFMVTPYMDHDLAGLLENPNVRFTGPQIKCYMQQLLAGTAYLHASKILHRDMKAANLLINNRGILQIADFGLARPYDDEPPQRGKGGGEATREYTTLVVTRWYRPPELLLQLRKYTTAIDMWGVGCVFGEMFTRKPILAGTSDLHQAQVIFDLVGSPTDENMPGWRDLPGVEGNLCFADRAPTLRAVFRDQPPTAVSLLEQLLTLDWRKRINAIDALEHPYFTTPPLPARPGDLPSFDDSHELDRRKFRDQKNKPPPAPAGGSVGIQANGEWAINGRPGPADARGGPGPYRPPPGGRPYYRDSGPRRPQQSYHDRNPARQADYRQHQSRNYGPQDSRRPPYDSGPRIPPPVHANEDAYPRRVPAPDTSLPPRPPPTESELMDGYRGPPPGLRRPLPRDEYDWDRDRGPPPSQRSQDYSERMYDDRPALSATATAAPRYNPSGRRPSRDYDYDAPLPLRYDDRRAPPRHGGRDSQDYVGGGISGASML